MRGGLCLCGSSHLPGTCVWTNRLQALWSLGGVSMHLGEATCNPNGALVLIGKDLLVETTAQVVWFVKPRFYWMIGGFGMMIIFRTRQVKKHENG